MDDFTRYCYREKSPCKECKERHEACWSSCDKYKLFKSRLGKIRENKEKAERLDRDISSILFANKSIRKNAEGS